MKLELVDDVIGIEFIVGIVFANAFNQFVY